MNNRDEIIKAHKELIKSMSVEQLKEVFDDNDLQEDYEKILFAMPKKAEMETFRVNLATNLINWVEYDHLSTEDITTATEYLLSIVEGK
jgi:hypothetical protein